MGGEGKVEGWEKNVIKPVGGNFVKNLKQNRRSIDPLSKPKRQKIPNRVNELI